MTKFVSIMDAYFKIVAFITEASNLISNAFWIILQLSSYVGHALVNQILFVLNYLSHISSMVITFLRILCEDTVVFYQDLGEKSSCLASFVASGISRFADGVTNISSSASLAGIKTINFICETSNSIVSAVSSLASLVKICIAFTVEGFLLIGSSIWLAVTGTPTGIVNCIIWLFVQLRNILNAFALFCIRVSNTVVVSIKDFYFYVSNIPCSSFLGLAIGFILFYSSVKNYRTLYSLILQSSRNIYCYISSLCYNLWNRSNRPGYNLNVPGIEEKLCIICQDRLKEVILMPCRHVCLCIQCSLHIARNHRYCPICRSHIQTTMKVYI